MTNHRNRAGTGRHRAAQRSAVAGVTFTALTALVVGNAGGALAAPGQPGVTAPAQQPGVTSPSQQPGVTTEQTAPPAPVQTWVPAPVEYQQPAQPLPNWDYETNQYTPPANSNDNYVAPIDYTTIHLPTQLETFTAPIQAPEDKIRFGRYIADRPNWISKETADKTNGQTAVIEAQVTDFWRSTLIIEDTEAARLAASQVGGGAAGALAGAGTAVAIAAPIGCAVGGTIGGTSALALFSPVVTPVLTIPAGVVGTGTGCGVGALVAGGVAGAGGALAGGAGGVLAASAYGAGDLGQPVEFEIPDVDQPAITEQTETTLDQWSASPPVGTAAADTVRNAVASAPVVDQQIRDAVTSLPGGEGAVAAFDQAVTDFQANTAVPGLPLGMIADAIGAGIPA